MCVNARAIAKMFLVTLGVSVVLSETSIGLLDFAFSERNNRAVAFIGTFLVPQIPKSYFLA